jgi:hypothetical protein
LGDPIDLETDADRAAYSRRYDEALTSLVRAQQARTVAAKRHTLASRVGDLPADNLSTTTPAESASLIDYPPPFTFVKRELKEEDGKEYYQSEVKIDDLEDYNMGDDDDLGPCDDYKYPYLSTASRAALEEEFPFATPVVFPPTPAPAFALLDSQASTQAIPSGMAWLITKPYQPQAPDGTPGGMRRLSIHDDDPMPDALPSPARSAYTMGGNTPAGSSG